MVSGIFEDIVWKFSVFDIGKVVYLLCCCIGVV